MTRMHRQNARRDARIVAKVDIEYEPTFAGSLDRFIERLDEQPEFRHLAFRSLEGAVRAAAKELGRYDVINDAILAAENPGNLSD